MDHQENDVSEVGEEDEIKEILIILSCYVRRMEDERGDSKRLILIDNPLLKDTSLKYLNEKQYSIISKILIRYSSSHIIHRLKPSIQSELYFYLGFSHEKGLFGMKKNHRVAFHHYVSSAQLNNPMGTFKVAQCYEKGVGKVKNIQRALYFYRCAAKLGLIDAMHTYGTIILFSSIPYDKQLEVGHFYLKLAARKANNTYPYPLYDLGRCYENGEGPSIVQSDDSYAFKLYLKGASLDCPNCQFRVGKCFEKGELGQYKNIQRAVEWYVKAADLGQSDAQLTLSTLFLSGIRNGLEKNHEMAFRFGLRAATREHTTAAYLISDYYERGVGVRRNTQLSGWWSRIADEFKKNQNESVRKIMITTSDDSVSDEQCDFEDGIVTGLIRAQ